MQLLACYKTLFVWELYGMLVALAATLYVQHWWYIWQQWFSDADTSLDC